MLREWYEEREKSFLSQYATLSSNTKGREIPVPLCDVRTEFQRDRDKILHSKAFRRLKHKTQVFIAPEGDHYRTRLTHTLEVSQIARTIARALCLNEDLTEACALGHDLGHTPFGHTGERVLDEICPYGFRHYQQSLRVVEHLENGKGLNLTWEVRDGIVNHTGEHIAATPEGQIIKLADRIAYINHDIDDAIRGGIISEKDLPKEECEILGFSHSKRINRMIMAVIEGSDGKPDVRMAEPVSSAMLKLRSFMFDAVYTSPLAKGEEEKAINMISYLYHHFLKNPSLLPDDAEKEDLHRGVCDYIAGMTDRFVVHAFQELFVPHFWSVY